jgi:spermidine synthase
MLFLNGAAAMLAQSVLFREILNQVYINELVLSSILAVWLLAGAFAAGFIHEKYLKKLDDKKLGLVFALAPAANAFVLVIVVFLIRYMKPALGMRPEMLTSIWDAIILSIIVFSPVSMLLAIGFTTASEIIKRQKAGGNVKFLYLFEAAGAVAAGFLYTLFISEHYGNLDVLYALGIINLAAVYMLFRDRTREARIIMLAVVAALIVFIGFSMAGLRQKADMAGSRVLYSGYTVIADREFPTVKLTIAKEGSTYLIFENGTLSYSIPDARYRETAGWAVLSHPGNGSVLVINGGIAGMIGGLSRYNSVKEITSIESDPYTAAVLGKIFRDGIKTDKSVAYESGDVIYYLRNGSSGPGPHNNKARTKYDTVIINFRQPNTIYGNRLFTKEFFETAKSHMNPGGVLAFTLPLGEDYAGGRLTAAAAEICAAAKTVFNTVKVVPGDSVMVLASTGNIELTPAYVMKRILDEKIKEPIFNSRYIEDKLNPDRVKKAGAILNMPKPAVNSLLSPSAYLSYIKADMLLFKGGPDIIKILLILAFFSVLGGRIFDLKIFRDNPAPYLAMLVTGFAAIVTELVLIVLFQSYYGYIYKMIGFLFAFFMLGAALGVLAAMTKIGSKINVIAVILAAVNAAIFVFSFTPPGPGAIIALMVLAGAATGAAFNALIKHADASMLYSSDMIGGSFGALLFNLAILPLAGIRGALVINFIMLAAVIFSGNGFGLFSAEGKNNGK